MPDNQGQQNINLNRELANHDARIEALETEIISMARDVREIRDTITGAKGSWKMIVAVVSMLAGALAMAANKLWDILTSSSTPGG